MATVALFYAKHPEGIIEWLQRSYCGDARTVYAAGYSEKNYWKIRKGMTQEDVLRLVGEPLNVFDVPGRTIWAYTDVRVGASESGLTGRGLSFVGGKVEHMGHSYTLLHDAWWCWDKGK
jgi:hypothetical protein